MDEKKLVHAPHVGPGPVQAIPNHVREKTYDKPATPNGVEREEQALPEKTTKKASGEDMHRAVKTVEKRM